MATKERRYVSTMSSIQSLENRCNFDELNIPGKLQSLKAATDNAGVKVTLAIYEIIEEPDGIGNLDLRKDENAKDSAWIMTVETAISIMRS